MIRFTAMGILRAGVILVMVSVAFSAAAEDKEAAKKAFSEATRYYNLNQYADALEAFKRAYWNYEDPVFLYNIAQCHRLLKHKAEAIDFYKSYLRNAPNARNRVEVQRVVADLEASLQQDRALANAPPEGPIQSTNTPPSTKITRSATSRAKLISCVTTSIVMPSRAKSRITSSTSPISSGSSAEVGSSNSITCGCIVSARAIATRCCWPPESRLG